MKNHYAVTVTDLSGSRHFWIRKTWKRDLTSGALVIVTLLGVSAAFILMQKQEIGRLQASAADMEQELLHYDSRYSSLSKQVAGHERQMARISSELVELERFSGMEIAHDQGSLADRVRNVGEFYALKAEMEEVGDLAEDVEEIPGEEVHVSQIRRSIDIAEQVELALLSESQDRILHDSIPNGYPTQNRVITSKFGYREDPISGVKTYHKGVDLRAKNNVDVFATADGIVRKADYTDLSGNRIVVQHNFGFESRYAHLDKMTVQPGDIIHKGDRIGVSGNSGRSVAPHLHYEIRYLGKSVDPSEFLEWEYGDHEIFTQVRGVKWQSLISLINKQITHQTLQLSLLDRALLER